MASFAKLWTTDPHDNIERWAGDGSADGWVATTVTGAFQHKAKLHADKVILRHKISKDQQLWDDWTWSNYITEVRKNACALLQLGFAPHDCVSILGANSPEWFAAAHGAIFAGGMSTGVYPSNSADGLQYVVAHSGSRILYVDGAAQLAKALEARKDCPKLVQIVSWGPPKEQPEQDRKMAVEWRVFQQMGSNIGDSQLQERFAGQRPGEACFLSYTSGTTGNPKAAMLSHDAALFGFRSWFTHGWNGLDMGLEERNVSYMPCSHIGGSVDLFGPLGRDDSYHSTIHFAFPDAMQGSLEVTLRDVLPTYLAAVPRIWQKLEAVMRQAQSDGATMMEARAKVGLQHAKWALSGSAPIELETLNYFEDSGLRIDEIYGMTETNVSLMGNAGAKGAGTVGVPVVPHSVRIDSASGEILVRHRCLMMGFMHETKKTVEAIDADGWLHTGDIGTINENGSYAITGRIKELIITAGGENIPPVPIEFALKDLLPCVSNAVVVGDGKKMLVCLFTPKMAPNPAGDPAWLQDLAMEAKDVDPAAKTAFDAQQSKRWHEELSQGVERYNKDKALSRAQNIRKFALLPYDFVSQGPDAELTPTLKLKRDVVFKKYATIIADLYAAEGPQSRL